MRTYPITDNFDDLFEELTASSYKSDVNYPPYNIYMETDDTDQGQEEGLIIEPSPTGIIEIAVTGLSETDVQVYFEEGVLVIEGNYPKDNEKIKQYEHRGLSSKDFVKKIQLEKNWEVEDIEVYNGLMTISFKENKPEKKFLAINGNPNEDKDLKDLKELKELEDLKVIVNKKSKKRRI